MKALLLCALVASLLSTVAFADSIIPYQLVGSPNINAPIGVMAIVPNKAKITPRMAASLAKFSSRQYREVKTWKGMQVFAFRDVATAKQFNQYQAKRKHWPLRAGDYVALRKLWPKALAVYEYRNGNEKVFFPARNPSGWWKAVR